MSTHSVNITEIETVLEHPNADALEIIPIGMWQCVSAKGNFKAGDRAIYIEPDYIVPTARPEFEFLPSLKAHRLKAIRLRGELSFGLLISVPAELDHLPIGTNVMEQLGIERYVPKETIQGADALDRKFQPKVAATSKFDVESLQKFSKTIQPTELVYVTEKIHGANARFTFTDDEFFIGSRTRWLKTDAGHGWKKAADNYPQIEEWCRHHPGSVLYGEIFGPIQSLRYNSEQVRFAAFAIADSTDNRVDVYQNESLKEFSIPVVPTLKMCMFQDVDLNIAEQNSLVAEQFGKKEQMMEGIVITPVVGRRERNCGFVQLKHISNRYWLKK